MAQTWVKTEDLKKALPPDRTSLEMSRELNVDLGVILGIKAVKAEFTDFYKADRVLTGLGFPYRLYELREYSHREMLDLRKHGLSTYNRIGCRCAICKRAKHYSDRRRNKLPQRAASNRRYRNKLQLKREAFLDNPTADSLSAIPKSKQPKKFSQACRSS